MTRALAIAIPIALLVVPARAQHHAPGTPEVSPPAQAQAVVNENLPPDESRAMRALDNSPRHGEFVEMSVPGSADRLKGFVVYPERPDKAPVVIVVHEIFGLTPWVRGVADQLAREGFIAIAPDFLSGKGPNGGGTDSLGDKASQVNSALDRAEAIARISAARDYAVKIPAATGRTAILGFCWGGQMAFAYALTRSDLQAAVSYYGPLPADAAAYDTAKVPVLGLYGENDQRVNVAIPSAVAEMKKHGASYEPHVYPGAGHGFLRQLSGQNGDNLRAAERAWPLTIEFLRTHTGG